MFKVSEVEGRDLEIIEDTPRNSKKSQKAYKNSKLWVISFFIVLHWKLLTLFTQRFSYFY